MGGVRKRGRYYGAAPPTTRGSTRSIWLRSETGSGDAREARLQREVHAGNRRGTGSPGSRAVCEQRAQRLESRRADRLRRTAPRGRPADALPRLARRAQPQSSPSSCARARTTPATGAGCSPIPASCWPMRWRASSRGTAKCVVPELLPEPIPDTCVRALADCAPRRAGRAGRWTAPGDRDSPLRSAGSRRMEHASNPRVPHRQSRPDPVNAIPPRASAHLQMRFVAGCDWREFAPCDSRASRRAGPHGGRVWPGWCAAMRRPASIRITPGCAGRRSRSRRPAVRSRRSCRTSAARCPTTASPKC